MENLTKNQLVELNGGGGHESETQEVIDHLVKKGKEVAYYLGYYLGKKSVRK